MVWPSQRILEIAAKTSYEKLIATFMNEMNYDHYFGLANREDENAPSGHMMEDEVWTEIGPNHEYNGVPEMMNAAQGGIPTPQGEAIPASPQEAMVGGADVGI